MKEEEITLKELMKKMYNVTEIMVTKGLDSLPEGTLTADVSFAMFMYLTHYYHNAGLPVDLLKEGLDAAIDLHKSILKHYPTKS